MTMPAARKLSVLKKRHDVFQAIAGGDPQLGEVVRSAHAKRGYVSGVTCTFILKMCARFRFGFWIDART